LKRFRRLYGPSFVARGLGDAGLSGTLDLSRGWAIRGGGVDQVNRKMQAVEGWIGGEVRGRER